MEDGRIHNLYREDLARPAGQTWHYDEFRPVVSPGPNTLVISNFVHTPVLEGVTSDLVVAMNHPAGLAMLATVTREYLQNRFATGVLGSRLVAAMGRFCAAHTRLHNQRYAPSDLTAAIFGGGILTREIPKGSTIEDEAHERYQSIHQVFTGLAAQDIHVWDTRASTLYGDLATTIQTLDGGRFYRLTTGPLGVRGREDSTIFDMDTGCFYSPDGQDLLNRTEQWRHEA